MLRRNSAYSRLWPIVRAPRSRCRPRAAARWLTVGIAQSRGGLDDAVEHGLQLGWRPADDARAPRWSRSGIRATRVSSAVRACTSSNSRVFSMAITAWSAKVSSSSICLGVKGGHARAVEREQAHGLPSRSSGTPSMLRAPVMRVKSWNAYSASASTSGMCTGRPSMIVRPASEPRPITWPISPSASTDIRGEAVAAPGRAGGRRAGRGWRPSVHRTGARQRRPAYRAPAAGRIRAADDAQHLARRRLLLQRLGQLRVRACTSSNSRVFSMAITAWSAKVVDELDLLVAERLHDLANQRR